MNESRIKTLLRRFWAGYGTSTVIALLWVFACMFLLNLVIYAFGDIIWDITPWTISDLKMMGGSVILAVFFVHIADLVRARHPIEKAAVPT